MAYVQKGQKNTPKRDLVYDLNEIDSRPNQSLIFFRAPRQLKRSALPLEHIRHRFRVRFIRVHPLRGHTKTIH